MASVGVLGMVTLLAWSTKRQARHCVARFLNSINEVFRGGKGVI